MATPSSHGTVWPWLPSSDHGLWINFLLLSCTCFTANYLPEGLGSSDLASEAIVLPPVFCSAPFLPGSSWLPTTPWHCGDFSRCNRQHVELQISIPSAGVPSFSQEGMPERSPEVCPWFVICLPWPPQGQKGMQGWDTVLQKRFRQ